MPCAIGVSWSGTVRLPVALEAGLTFVAKYRDNESARSKLNEGEPGWLEPNQFELVYHSVTDQHHLALYDTYGKHFKNARRPMAA